MTEQECFDAGMDYIRPGRLGAENEPGQPLDPKAKTPPGYIRHFRPHNWPEGLSAD